MKTYLDYEDQVLAHRDGEESYENTLESFEYSQSLGCNLLKQMFKCQQMEFRIYFMMMISKEFVKYQKNLMH